MSREPTKRLEIVDALRQRIISGELPVGAQIPTYVQLQNEFNAGSVTVRRAMEFLSREGFIITRGRGGMYVDRRPPHLHRYAVAFPSWFDSSRFMRALHQETVRLAKVGAYRVECYYNVDEGEGSEDYERLLEDSGNHSLAGVIMAFAPHFLLSSPLLAEEAPPLVSMFAGPIPTAYTIFPDLDNLYELAIDHMVRQGCKRVAWMTLPPGDISMYRDISNRLAERGIETRPYWWQSAGANHPETARNVIHLLMAGCDPSQRPDGLVITDDNLVPHATAGLLAAGVRVPDEVEVVAHANFPWSTTSVVPAVRIGFDVRRMLAYCIDTIDRARRGEPAKRHQLLPARKHEEATSAMDLGPYQRAELSLP